MKFKDVIDDLAKNASASIRFRVRTEILGESERSPCCKSLRRDIEDDPLVKDTFSWFDKNGDFPERFGQNRSLYNAARIWHEKAADLSDTRIEGIVSSLDYIHRCGPLVGRRAVTGYSMAHTGEAIVHRYLNLRETDLDSQVQEWSIESYANVADLDRLDDVLSAGKNGGVFKTSFCWPDQYDLELVALSKLWRTKKNQEMIIRAMAKMCHLFPKPDGNAKTKYLKVQSKQWQNYSVSYSRIQPSLPSVDHQWNRYWFKTYELLSRMPFVLDVNVIKSVVTQLYDKLDEAGGWFKDAVDSKSWNFWACYSGLALEPSQFSKQPYSWLSERGRINDTTFRSLLILSNFGFLQ